MAPQAPPPERTGAGGHPSGGLCLRTGRATPDPDRRELLEIPLIRGDHSTKRHCGQRCDRSRWCLRDPHSAYRLGRRCANHWCQRHVCHRPVCHRPVVLAHSDSWMNCRRRHAQASNDDHQSGYLTHRRETNRCETNRCVTHRCETCHLPDAHDAGTRNSEGEPSFAG